jgi:hypothetical protein
MTTREGRVHRNCAAQQNRFFSLFITKKHSIIIQQIQLLCTTTMALNPRSKQWYETSSRYASGREYEDEEHMSIPAVIIVPRRSYRVTSTMEQLYREMPGTSNSGGDDDSSKPWQVDMARKSYRERRYGRSKRAHQSRPPTLPSAPESPPPPVTTVSFSRNMSPCVQQDAPELDGSWAKGSHDDSGYPSDEEDRGFGGRSSSNSSPNNSYTSPTVTQQSRPVRSHLYFYRRS